MAHHPKHRLSSPAHLLAFLLVVSCGGSSAPSAAEVSARCDKSGETLCALNVACGIDAHWIPSASRDDAQASCITGYKLVADCSRKTKLTGNPDTCEADFARTPCTFYEPPSGIPLPASCKAIFE